MNSTEHETLRRQRIVDGLFSRFDVEAFDGVLLQGSMVYGKNHAVTVDSDIDLLFVLPPENLDWILRFELFESGYVNEVVQNLFSEERIDCTWTDHTIDGVLLNMGLIRSGFFRSWTHLRSLEMRRCRTDKPSRLEMGVNSCRARTARGIEVDVEVSLQQIRDRYLITIPMYHGDELLEQRLFGSFLLSEILYDRDGVVAKNLEHLLKRLLELYGEDFVLRLMEYGLSKASPDFRNSFHRRIGYMS